MFRHCVMFRWKPDTPAEAVAAVEAGLHQMAQLPMVSSYRFGPDAGVSEGNFDYVVVGDFATVDDYKAYATDPSHLLLIADHIRPHVADRAAVQYEL